MASWINVLALLKRSMAEAQIETPAAFLPDCEKDCANCANPATLVKRVNANKTQAAVDVGSVLMSSSSWQRAVAFTAEISGNAATHRDRKDMHSIVPLSSSGRIPGFHPGDAGSIPVSGVTLFF